MQVEKTPEPLPHPYRTWRALRSFNQFSWRPFHDYSHQDQRSKFFLRSSPIRTRSCAPRACEWGRLPWGPRVAHPFPSVRPARLRVRLTALQAPRPASNSKKGTGWEIQTRDQSLWELCLYHCSRSRKFICVIQMNRCCIYSYIQGLHIRYIEVVAMYG